MKVRKCEILCRLELDKEMQPHSCCSFNTVNTVKRVWAVKVLTLWEWDGEGLCSNHVVTITSRAWIGFSTFGSLLHFIFYSNTIYCICNMFSPTPDQRFVTNQMLSLLLWGLIRQRNGKLLSQMVKVRLTCIKCYLAVQSFNSLPLYKTYFRESTHEMC